MVEASRYFPEYQFVVAGAPGISREFYSQFIGKDVKIVFSQTYRLLQHSTAAMVTSGTATLETALFNVPQVVCYYMSAGKIVSFLRKYLLKVKYISLVNLITDSETVKELVADDMNVKKLKDEMSAILIGGSSREKMLESYGELKRILGDKGASHRAAGIIVDLLRNRKHKSAL